MGIVVTISAPSSAEVGKWFNISGIVYDSTTGYPIPGAIVDLYYNGSSLGSTSTGVDGDYLATVRINVAGTFQLKAIVGTASASRNITITEPEEPEPPPPEIVVTISAPSSAEAGQYFAVSGIVYDSNTGYPVVGATVNIYYNGAFLGSATTGIDGDYLDSVRINEAGTFMLKSVYGTASATRSITITEPVAKKPTNLSLTASPASGTAPFYTTLTATLTSNGAPVGYKEVEIYMRHAGIPWTKLTWGDTDSSGVRSFIIHVGLVPIEFYARFAGDNEYEACVSPTITITEAPVGIPTTLTIFAPDEVGPGETFTIFGQLTRNDTGTAIPSMSINVSYNGTPLGSVLTDMQGVYTIPASIPDPGTYTLRADFLGTAEYAASKSQAATMVTTPLMAAIKLAGSIATGLILFIYGTS